MKMQILSPAAMLAGPVVGNHAVDQGDHNADEAAVCTAVVSNTDSDL